jgi:catechol 2,3-dioxygenase-like lactoylglutathione lyase family enzyme
MGPIVGLGHFGIYVRDLDRMVGFYRDTLGLKVTKQTGTIGAFGNILRDNAAPPA